MNMVALSNRLASKVPHWHELEKLSKEDKIDVIALLSMSIANAEEIKKPENRTLSESEEMDIRESCAYLEELIFPQ